MACPIDVVVGRDPASVRSLRGDVQEAYDALDEEGQLALDRYLAYLLAEQNGRARRAGQAEERRWERLAERYEDMYLASLPDERAVALLSGGRDAELREGYENYVRSHRAAPRADGDDAAGGEGDDEERVRRLMAVYDEYHPQATRTQAEEQQGYISWDEAHKHDVGCAVPGSRKQREED